MHTWQAWWLTSFLLFREWSVTDVICGPFIYSKVVWVIENRREIILPLYAYIFVLASWFFSCQWLLFRCNLFEFNKSFIRVLSCQFRMDSMCICKVCPWTFPVVYRTMCPSYPNLWSPTQYWLHLIIPHTSCTPCTLCFTWCSTLCGSSVTTSMFLCFSNSLQISEFKIVRIFILVHVWYRVTIL